MSTFNLFHGIQFSTRDVFGQSLPSRWQRLVHLVVGHACFFFYYYYFFLLLDRNQCVFLFNLFVVAIACCVFLKDLTMYRDLNKYNCIMQCFFVFLLCFLRCSQGFGCRCVPHGVMIQYADR